MRKTKMGCNCKSGKPQKMNNLDSIDHLKLAINVFKEVIEGKDIQTLNDLDKIQIMDAYRSLYPNASASPSLDDAINAISVAINLYQTKYVRK